VYQSCETVLMLSYIFVAGGAKIEAKGGKPHVTFQAASQKWLFEAGGRQLT